MQPLLAGLQVHPQVEDFVVGQYLKKALIRDLSDCTKCTFLDEESVSKFFSKQFNNKRSFISSLEAAMATDQAGQGAQCDYTKRGWKKTSLNCCGLSQPFLLLLQVDLSFTFGVTSQREKVPLAKTILAQFFLHPASKCQLNLS